MLESIVSESSMLGPMLVTFIIGMCTSLLLYWFSIRNHDYWKKQDIPFVKPYPFVGSILSNLRKPFHEIELLRYKEHGALYGHFEGNHALVSIADPTLLRDILVKDFQYFPGRRSFSMGDSMVDSMLSALQGEDWKRVRTIVTPTFTTGRIKKMMGIFKDCSKTLVQNFQKSSEQGTHLEAKRFYGAFSMDIIASSAFSTKIDSHNDPENKFVATARSILKQKFSWRIILFLLVPKVCKFLGIAVFNPKVMDFFKQATYGIIKERKRTGQTRNDFLQLLLDTAEEVGKEAKEEEVSKEDETSNYGEAPSTHHQVFRNTIKKNLSMDELVGQCVIFFLAGYDTTASTLAFATYEMAVNPELQEKAQEEVDRVLQQYGGELTYEAAQEMKLIDNVISETLRKYPPAVRMERVADAAYKLGDTGLTIPKGMIVTIPNYAMHHDPELFPEPETFNPDRFTAEEKGKRDPYAYMPFGGGPRNCVAMRFALIEIKVCLINVLANFNVKRCPQTKVPLEFHNGQGLLQPKEINVKLEVRENCHLIK